MSQQDRIMQLIELSKTGWHQLKICINELDQIHADYESTVIMRNLEIDSIAKQLQNIDKELKLIQVDIHDYIANSTNIEQIESNINIKPDYPEFFSCSLCSKRTDDPCDYEIINQEYVCCDTRSCALAIERGIIVLCATYACKKKECNRREIHALNYTKQIYCNHCRDILLDYDVMPDILITKLDEIQDAVYKISCDAC